ncbi:MAG: iron-containing alcohol dehydrogenase [Planctomycetes bacterium]|nr:iron-containing alcohol dehydrogenase [Planctomycetota bacterium]
MSEYPNMDLFGSTFACACGKAHTIEPERIIYDVDAANLLPGIIRDYTTGRKVAVLMDIRTREAAGEDVLAALEKAAWKVQEVVIPDSLGDADRPGTPICDDLTLAVIAEKITHVDILVAVGSGVINDLTKWLAFERKLPYVVFATANSMNGYASANIATTEKGVKGLLYAKTAQAVFTSPEVLRDAPYHLTTAGLGDILAKSVSSVDWRLNHLIFGDYFCERSVNLISEIEPLYLDHPEKILNGDAKAIETLFYGLLLTGVSMNMAGTSAPSSGAEHMLSHTFDMWALKDGTEHDLHGRQVGLGTIFASELYRRVLAVESPIYRAPREKIDAKFWGHLGAEVKNHYTEKIPRLHQAFEFLQQGSAWDELRATLSSFTRPPEVVRNCLEKAKAAYCCEDLGYDPGYVLEAFIHSHEIRDRFTILDLAGLIGIMPKAADEIIEKWG